MKLESSDYYLFCLCLLRTQGHWQSALPFFQVSHLSSSVLAALLELFHLATHGHSRLTTSSLDTRTCSGVLITRKGVTSAGHILIPKVIAVSHLRFPPPHFGLMNLRIQCPFQVPTTFCFNLTTQSFTLLRILERACVELSCRNKHW